MFHARLIVVAGSNNDLTYLGEVCSATVSRIKIRDDIAGAAGRVSRRRSWTLCRLYRQPGRGFPRRRAVRRAACLFRCRSCAHLHRYSGRATRAAAAARGPIRGCGSGTARCAPSETAPRSSRADGRRELLGHRDRRRSGRCLDADPAAARCRVPDVVQVHARQLPRAAFVYRRVLVNSRRSRILRRPLDRPFETAARESWRFARVRRYVNDPAVPSVVDREEVRRDACRSGNAA